MQRSAAPTQAILRKAVEEGGLNELDTIIQAIQQTDAIAYTLQRATRETELAIENLSVLPASNYKQALENLAWFAIKRSH